MAMSVTNDRVDEHRSTVRTYSDVGRPMSYTYFDPSSEGEAVYEWTYGGPYELVEYSSRSTIVDGRDSTVTVEVSAQSVAIWRRSELTGDELGSRFTDCPSAWVMDYLRNGTWLGKESNSEPSPLPTPFWGVPEPYLP